MRAFAEGVESSAEESKPERSSRMASVSRSLQLNTLEQESTPKRGRAQRGLLLRLIRHLLAYVRSLPWIDLGGPSVHQIQQLDGYLMIVAVQFVTFRVVDRKKDPVFVEVAGWVLLGCIIPTGIEAAENIRFEKS